MSNPNRPKTKFYVFRKLIAAFLVIAVAGALVASNILIDKITTVIKASPEMDLEKFRTAESTIIYDMNGEEVVKLGLNVASNITYEQMPNTLIDAFLSIEDSQFFEHDGVDMPRLLLTTAKNFLTRGKDTGASTITMQTIKKSLFESDDTLAAKSYERKIQEIALSSEIESKISKKNILELYVNKIQYGAPNSRGVQRAAEYYFGKDVSELTLSESAYLAGVINAPSAFNAYRNLEGARNRRNAVLDNMVRHGYITPTERDLAKAVKLENQLVGEDKFSINKFKYNDYIDQVLYEAQELTGLDPMVNGMQIYTSLNPIQQDLIEDIQHQRNFKYSQDIIQSAFVVINNQKGEIVAIGGGKVTDETVSLGLNRVRSNRQVGSAMKAVLPYMLAFDNLGWSNMHVIEDGPYFYKGTNTQLQNASRTYIGDMILRDALAASKNIPAIKTMDEVIEKIGNEAIRDFLRKLDYPEPVVAKFKDQYAIGGAEYAISPITAAGHHTVAMNGGKYIKPHTIKRIEMNGQPPLVPEYKPIQLVSEGAAYMAADIMKYAVDVTGFGTDAMRLKQRFPVYAKTGSSNWGIEGPSVGQKVGALKDSWFIASTSEYTIANWMGLDKASDGRITNRNTLRNSQVKMVNSLLKETTKFSKPTLLKQPADVVQVKHILATFPYARPIENMSVAYIANALILKDNAKLVDFTAPKIEDLKEQKVNSTKLLFGIFNLDVAMTPYPQAQNGSTPGKATKVMSATSANGKTITATGRVLFDPSWVFGGAQYGTSVIRNGEVIQEVINANPQRNITLLGISSNTNLEVCSFYTWASQPTIRSNSVCQLVNSGDDTITFPNFISQPIQEFQNWIATNSEASVKTSIVTPSEAAQVGKIYNLSPNYAGQNVDRLELNQTKFEVAYYDQTISGLQSNVGKRLNTFKNPNPNILQVRINGSDNPQAIIRSIAVNNRTLDNFSLSQLGGQYLITIGTEAEVNKSELKQVLDTANSLVKQNYSSGWDSFDNARKHAQQVYNKADVTQAEVNQATNLLKTAMANLVEVVIEVPETGSDD